MDGAGRAGRARALAPAARPIAALLHRLDLPLRAAASRPLSRGPPVRLGVLRAGTARGRRRGDSGRDDADRALQLARGHRAAQLGRRRALPAALSRGAAGALRAARRRAIGRFAPAAWSATRCASSTRSRRPMRPTSRARRRCWTCCATTAARTSTPFAATWTRWGSPIRSIRVSCAGSTTTPAPSSRSPRARSAPRAPSAAAAATTDSSPRWAGRRPRRSASASASSVFS